jgi:hypothetical protein
MPGNENEGGMYEDILHLICGFLFVRDGLLLVMFLLLVIGKGTKGGRNWLRGGGAKVFEDYIAWDKGIIPQDVLFRFFGLGKRESIFIFGKFFQLDFESGKETQLPTPEKGRMHFQRTSGSEGREGQLCREDQLWLMELEARELFVKL